MKHRNVSTFKVTLSLAFVGVFLAAGVGPTWASPVGIINNNTRPLTGSPMQIESCIVSPSLSAPVQAVAQTGIGFLGGRINGIAGILTAAGGATVVALAARKSNLTVRMSNEGNTTITAIRIETDGANAPVYERENLTLAPGEIISRKYSGAGFQQNGQAVAVNCRVDWVQFADGTSLHPVTNKHAKTKIKAAAPERCCGFSI